MYAARVEMNFKSTEFERSVYTVWDWMGDVGGLFGTLSILGAKIVTIVSYISGNSLTRELIENLYFVEAPRRWMEMSDIGTWLKRRKPAKFETFNVFRCHRDDNYNRQSYELEKELDIVNFLRKQMIGKVTQRLVFTRL